MPFFPNHHNLEVYYEVINAEKNFLPVIFVHGYGSSFSIFQSQISQLKYFFKLILFDAEGHGRSQKSQSLLQDHLIDQTLVDMDLLLNQLEIQGELGIIGHSLMGSCVAIKFYIQNPSRVKFLILMNGGLIELDSTIRIIFWNLLPQFTRMNFFEIAQISLCTLIEKTLPFIKEAINSLQIPSLPNLSSLDEKIKDDIEDMVDNILDPSSIQCPTLIIGAELDNFAPIFFSKDMHKKIYHSEYYIITLAGHFGPSQRSKEYNQLIKNFLMKNKILLLKEKE